VNKVELKIINNSPILGERFNLEEVFGALSTGKSVSYITKDDGLDLDMDEIAKHMTFSPPRPEGYAEYEDHLRTWAFNDAEDGEHGVGIASRMEAYESKLSFEDYKNGKRLYDREMW
jgi:hypothetical protein